MHLNKKIGLVLLTGLILAVGSPLVRAAPAARDVTAPALATCADDSTSYSALYQIEPGSYDIYAKLGQFDQQAPGRLFFQGFTETQCRTLGATTVNGSSWTKIGSIASQGKDGFGTLTFSSPAIDGLPVANRPTIMLVSQVNPVCQPTTECYVTIAGQQASLKPTGTLLNENSLHVVTVKDPATDKISQVDYFVDDKFVYTTKTLETFNQKYVSSGKHTLSSVISYQSKQQATIKTQVNQPYYSDVAYYLYSIWHQNHLLFTVGGVLLLGLIVLELIVFGIRAFHRHRVWKKTHYTQIDPNAPSVTIAEAEAKQQLEAQKPHHNYRGTAQRIGWIGGCIVVVIAIMAVLSAWVVQPFAVDGPSMQSTLHTDDQLVINKFPKTFASIAHQKYIPKPGQVIVFIKAQNVSSLSPEDSGPTYVVKRVVGLPGNRVTVKAGKITVYDAAHPTGFDPDVAKPWTKNLHIQTTDVIDITLGPDELFVVGDNRPESVDSRYYGSIKLNQVVGRAEFRLKPFTRL